MCYHCLPLFVVNNVLPLLTTLQKVYERNFVNKYRIFFLLGAATFNLIDHIYIYVIIHTIYILYILCICVYYIHIVHSIPPAIRGGYVPSPPANPENLRIIDAVVKRLCMILYIYIYIYASKTHSIDSPTQY